MPSDKIFPSVLIILQLIAAGIYISGGDWRRFCFWIAAAGMNIVVTF